jgi:hypothetical protein
MLLRWIVDCDVLRDGNQRRRSRHFAGAVLSDAEAAAEAIDLTKAFLSTLIGGVQAGLAAGEDLHACFQRVEREMRPRFGEWPVFQHVLPFDVSRRRSEVAAATLETCSG